MTADDIAGAEFLYPSGTGSGLPDLRPRDLAVSPGAGLPGRTLEVTWQLENAGTAPATPRETAVLLSTNTTLTTQDTVLELVAASGGTLAPGARRAMRATVQVPARATPGTYTLGVFVDPREQEDEGEEGNNTLGQSFVVQSAPTPTPTPTPPPPAPTPTPPPPPPPLAPTVDWTPVDPSITPDRVSPGDRVTLTFRLRQQGSGAAAARPEYRVVVSPNRTLSTSDVEVQLEPEQAGTFPIGHDETVSLGFTVGLPAGTWFLGVILDPDGQSVEAREDNDQAAAQLVVVDPAAPPPPAPTPAPPPAPAPAPPPPAATPPPPPASTAPGATPAPTPNRVAPAGGGGGGGGCALGDERAAPTTSLLLLTLVLLALRLRFTPAPARRAAPPG